MLLSPPVSIYIQNTINYYNGSIRFPDMRTCDMTTLKRLKTTLLNRTPHHHHRTTKFHPIPLTKPKSPMRLVAVDNGFQNSSIADTLFLVWCNGRYSHYSYMATGTHPKISLCIYHVEGHAPYTSRQIQYAWSRPVHFSMTATITAPFSLSHS
jgi:hypothetical protein